MSEARELLKRSALVLHDTFDGVKHMDPLIQEIDAYLTKPEPKPVAWTGSGSLEAIKNDRSGFIWGKKYKSHPIPLYAEPPARKPLSDDEILQAGARAGFDVDYECPDTGKYGFRNEDGDVDNEAMFEFARAIEKAHGIE